MWCWRCIVLSEVPLVGPMIRLLTRAVHRRWLPVCCMRWVPAVGRRLVVVHLLVVRCWLRRVDRRRLRHAAIPHAAIPYRWRWARRWDRLIEVPYSS